MRGTSGTPQPGPRVPAELPAVNAESNYRLHTMTSGKQLPNRMVSTLLPAVADDTAKCRSSERVMRGAKPGQSCPHGPRSMSTPKQTLWFLSFPPLDAQQIVLCFQFLNIPSQCSGRYRDNCRVNVSSLRRPPDLLFAPSRAATLG